MKKIFVIGLLTFFAISFGSVIKADDDLPELVIIEFDGEDEELPQNEWFQYPEYQQWGKVSVEGKLKMKGLPVTPSVKIYMEEDRLIDISVRAPFVGEAIRIELTPDSITAVNKMKKTYVKEANPLNFYGKKSASRGISEMQDLILGRFFLPGIDVKDANLDNYVEVFSNGDGLFNVVPIGNAEIEGIKYGFVVDNYFTPKMLVVLAGKMEVDALYVYKDNGYNIDLTYNNGQHLMSPSLELKNPEWGTGKTEGIKIDRKYKKMGLEDFVRDF